MGFLSKVTQALRESGLAGEGLATTRKLEGIYGLALKIIAAAFSLFFLYTTFFGLISQESHVGVYFLGTFVLSFMLYKSGKSPRKSTQCSRRTPHPGDYWCDCLLHY